MAREKIFVYGTLRKGFSRHRYLSTGTEFLGIGYVSGLLYDLGDYPGVILSNEGSVKGEMYSLEDSELLQKLDRIEGYNDLHPERSLFLRTTADVTMEDGVRTEAWIYILPSKPPLAQFIASGDYHRES